MHKLFWVIYVKFQLFSTFLKIHAYELKKSSASFLQFMLIILQTLAYHFTNSCLQTHTTHNTLINKQLNTQKLTQSLKHEVSLFFQTNTILTLKSFVYKCVNQGYFVYFFTILIPNTNNRITDD
ncbi:protein of unknown function [Tenacibaculum sp. 190524A02b]